MPRHKVKAYSAALTNTVVDIEIVGNCRFSLLDMGNNNAVASYVQMFNRPASTIVLGTTPPFLSFFVPISGGRVVALGTIQDLGGDGFSLAATTTRAGSTSPVSAVDVNIIL